MIKDKKFIIFIIVIISACLAPVLFWAMEDDGNPTMILGVIISAIVLISLVLISVANTEKAFSKLLEEQAQKRAGRMIRQSGSPALLLRSVNYEYRVFPFSRGSGRSRLPYTGIDIQLPLLKDLKVNVRPENALTGIGKALGMKDLVFNHPAFDAAFVISSNHEQTVRKLLNMELRNALISLRPKYPALTIEDGKVLFEVPERVRESQVLDQMIVTFEILLKRLTEAR